ncbi:MAG: ABC transporter ATP-binding protein [Candidatus Neomarinimicrobiota bacterium]|nr:MAG: ABC transporter ATP-binding protein [Candidatus Neomarinimicrobiota bacterium]
MSDTVISVENLSKRYRIGLKEEMHDTIVGAMLGIARRPFTNLKRLRKLSAFGKDDHEQKDVIWALDDVSFEVKRGELIGIIGRNGSGKSTLLKILSRITEPTKGRAVVHGRVGSLLEVGTGFHPELTGRDNVYLNGTILGMKKAEIDRKFDEIAAFSEIEKFIDTPVKRYSSGMRVRLAFAVAAYLQPEILLVDEVLAVGDMAFQTKCIKKMGEVAIEGRTVLFVSHKMASVKRLCETVYWLENGRLRQGGPTDEVVSCYEKETLDKANSHSQNQIIAVNDEHGVEVNGIHTTIDSGNGISSLIVKVKGRTMKLIARLGIGLQITTPDGTLVSRIGARLAKSIMENVNGDWEGLFKINDITRYLTGGDYLLQVKIIRPMMGVILNIEDASIVHVPQKDFYKAGVYLTSITHGIVPLPVSFHYRKA